MSWLEQILSYLDVVGEFFGALYKRSPRKDAVRLQINTFGRRFTQRYSRKFSSSSKQHLQVKEEQSCKCVSETPRTPLKMI
jgi:hypothetical protein